MSRLLILALLITAIGCGSSDPGTGLGIAVDTVNVTPDTVALGYGEVTHLTARLADAQGASLEGEVRWTVRDPTKVLPITTTELVAAVQPAAMGATYVVASHATGVRDSAKVVVTSGPPGTNPPPPPPPPAVPACAPYPHLREVAVTTPEELEAALAGALPGDLIALTPGSYTGNWESESDGTADHPIILCGTEEAILRNGDTRGGGYALTVRGDHWMVIGFQITESQQGIRLEGSRHSIVRRLEIHHIGQEAVKLRLHSRHNLVDSNTIHHTGIVRGEFGEGIYLGTAHSGSQWVPLGGPDRTDSNTIRHNVIGPNIGSEHVDGKVGTTGNVIEGNTFNGESPGASPFWVDSWVEVQGNNYVVRGNRGARPLKHGLQTYRYNLTNSGRTCRAGSSGCASWGLNTLYEADTLDMQDPREPDGYAIVLSQGATAVVRCATEPTPEAERNHVIPSTVPLVRTGDGEEIACTP